MSRAFRHFLSFCLLALLAALASRPALAQSLPAPRITQPIDSSQRVTLKGNVHPLARPIYDQGAVSDSFPAERMLLLLQRSQEQETALQQFLQDAHTLGSASYHKWLTPDQFGRLYGPADSDVAAVTGWLQSQGFNVARVTKSKQFIEFSGTAGQLRRALQADIHQYNVAGETHFANANEVSIPAALAPVVRGISPLNNFHAKPYVKVAGPALYSRSTKKTTPLWTIPNPFGTPNPYAYPVAPEDLATQYDLAPLYQAGVDGTGQTIGIINESNIDISLVNAYQQLFGLPGNPPQVVIDGDDPGTLDGVDVEAYLDVEVSGAVAPKATVNLYISNGSDLQDPVSLAAIRAVEENQASVLSVSFGNCEAYLGNAGNQLWSELWEQAAAQGQTVFVAAGDNGPECELFGDIAVSGLASTPWNVAVGGTDFYYSDYATGGASATTLWNQTNDANLGSLIAPLPEQVWNDPFGLDVISDGLARNEFYAGGGGASNCSTSSSTTGDCVSGYPKPSWQSGPGVPADGVRDLPDVSLFASNGANLSAYAICAYEGECAVGAGSEVEYLLAGGTSASTPAMAGIMALVNQKHGRQGQANFTLYPLSQQKPTAFHDITLGSNSVLCGQGSPDCAPNGNQFNGNPIYATTVYSAGPNYDQASGLGSVDANVLVNNWNAITFLPTTTTLHLSSTSITHGTPITVTTSVAPASGSGTPTGNVAILTNSPLPSSQSQTFVNLAAGTGSTSINYFPGGYYDVSASYYGDGIFGNSTSSPVALTVTPENSNINFSLMSGQTVIKVGSSIQYNAPLALNIQPIGVSALAGTTDGNATGTATFTVDSIAATVPLNAVGVASWSPPALAIGTHTASATYSGDASFNASSASPVTFSVTKGLTSINDSIDWPNSTTGPGYTVPVGGSLTITIVVKPFYGGLGAAAPTGTITACLGPGDVGAGTCWQPSYSQTATLASPSGNNAQSSSATVTFSNLAAGAYLPSFTYSGDANWQTYGLFDLSIILVSSTPSLTASTTTLSVTPASFSGTQLATVTTTVTGTGSSGVAPTGEVDYYNNGIFLTYIILTPAKTGATDSASFQVNASWFWNNGPNQITAIYLGDANYQPSTSNVVNIMATQTVGDFTIAPQLPQITVAPGSSGTVGLNLASLSNFNGVVSLTCATSSSNVSCGVNPPAPTLNGTATAMLTINASAQAAGLLVPPRSRQSWLGVEGGFVFAAVLLGGFVNRKRGLSKLLSVGLFAALFVAAGCGGGGSQNVQPPPPPPNGVAYSVVVSATANGIIHNAKITVIVR